MIKFKNIGHASQYHRQEQRRGSIERGQSIDKLRFNTASSCNSEEIHRFYSPMFFLVYRRLYFQSSLKQIITLGGAY